MYIRPKYEISLRQAMMLEKGEVEKMGVYCLGLTVMFVVAITKLTSIALV